MADAQRLRLLRGASAHVDLWLGQARRSPRGLAAHSFHHRGRDEGQRGRHGTHAYRYERGARSGPDFCSGRWWRRVETERFRHVMPAENLKVDGAPGEYPYNAADSPQPFHPQISGRCCRCCMGLVYHGCWLAVCSPAVPDDLRRFRVKTGQDEHQGTWQSSPAMRSDGQPSVHWHHRTFAVSPQVPQIGQLCADCEPLRRAPDAPPNGGSRATPTRQRLRFGTA